ncbi:MAG: hypothetical protein LUQ50_15030 [Methanospirillum sp.]|uniref:hypothetical protein n=1 Tax=Methanospirillum sp. TaxID=45200 RepID=UPI0023702B31|nr:hypothetical protein [Methanospirillum sp.]MDD1730367.1 hypothetical protein [Methanospirillum sp.]
MSDTNNPLKNIPPAAFSIFQASHKDFHSCLADIPRRYPTGRITYINNHDFVPLLLFKDEDMDRLDHLKIGALPELLEYIAGDTSAILFIEYHLSWFKTDKEEEMIQFCEVCRSRSRRGGPVVVVTAIMDRSLLALDGKADHFHQVRTWGLKKVRAIKEQTYLDSIPEGPVGVMEKGRLYGQMKLEW